MSYDDASAGGLAPDPATQWVPLDPPPRGPAGEHALTPAAAQPLGASGAAGSPVGRRVFLGLVGAGALGVALGSRVQSAIGRVVSSVSSSAGSGLGALIPGADRFRLYTVTGSFPEIAEHRYRLRVGGLVDRPFTLSFEQLQSLPRTKLVKPFQCVTGWRVPGVEWQGVLLKDLLALARPTGRARGVELSSYDGVYTDSLTLEEAQRDDVIVAYQMLGAPITSGHGGPVRLYVAPMYGYKSVKWLKSIQLVEHTTPGFWEQQGYDVEAWIGRSNGLSGAPID